MANMPIALEIGPFSVQWLETAPGPCAACSCLVGSGPVGFSIEEPTGPLCDGCLLDQCPGLGMLLMMANVNRELAQQTTEEGDPERADDCMVALMTVARMYDRGAGWPVRSSKATTFIEDLENRARHFLMQLVTSSSN